MISNRLTIFSISFALFALIGIIALPQSTLAEGPIILSDISNNSENNFVPGQIIIGLKNDPSSVESDIKFKGGKILEANDKLNALLVKVPNKAEDAFLEAMKNNPNVTFVVKNHVVTKSAIIPNDPYWGDQWDMKIIKAHDAWNTVLGSDTVTVAVLDTGVEYTHDDLSGVTRGDDYSNDSDGNDPMDRDGHGTHVAGTIGATINNGIGMAGLAQVEILAVQVLNDSGSGSDWSVSQGITFAETRADIINLSLGCACVASDLPATRDALASAYSNNVLIVAAAGNDGSSEPHYPSDDPNAISVSATSKADTIASYSNWGDNIELAAPGGDQGRGPYWKTYILSTYLNNGYAYATGTSMASPHVAGVAALVLAENPGLSNDDLRAHLQNTADDLGAAGKDQFYGYGRVNAQNAVETSLSPNNPPTPEITSSETSPTNVDPVSFSVDFGEAIDPNTFDASDITASSGTVQSLTNTGNDQNWTFKVASPTDLSTLSVSISADVLTYAIGNLNSASNTVNIDIDRTESAAPSINLPSSPTTDNTPTITGTGVSGETITLTSDLDVNVGTTTVLVDNWSITTSTLQTGLHSLSATQTDSAGNTSPPSSPVNLQVDALPGVIVDGIEPETGSKGESFSITVTGSGFVSGAQVTLVNGNGPTPSVSGELVSGDGTTITATITIKNGGPRGGSSWDVTVTNTDSSSDTLVDGFTVTP